MRRILILLIAVLALTAIGAAQESVNLTSPASIGTRSTWSVNYVHIEFQPTTRIVVELQDNLGNVVRDEHNATTTPTGAALLAALNTANLSTAGNSLAARLLKHVQGEGKIGAGSVSGTPQ